MDERDLTTSCETIQFQNAVGYLIMLVVLLLLLVHVRTKQKEVYHGNSIAARHVILPAFEPLIWTLIAALTGYCVFFWSAVASKYTKWLFNRMALSVVYAGRQFMFFVVIFYFYQISVSIQALRRSIGIALLLSLVPVMIVVMSHFIKLDTDTMYILMTIYRAFLSLLFLWMLRWPRSRASISSLRAFCIYYLGSLALVVASTELFRQSREKPELLYPATIFIVVTGYYDSVLPFFVWWLLVADTNHWRGLSDRACSLQSIISRTDTGDIQVTSAHGLHVLVELHRKHVFDFAELQLLTRIGCGASSKVFKGKLRSKTDVAIKVYTPVEINEQVIASFSHEAAFCSILDHPNIVAFHGMCVYPPTTCLVYELCRGSVHDVLATQLHYHIEQHFALDLCIMLDAARAVAYLHSFSPPMIHRDIKPANLMVDDKHVVKLADFGMSKQQSDDPRFSFVGTIEYMAPEIIQCDGTEGCTEKIDIFSLGMTLWDILHHGEEKYPSNSQIFGLVARGIRPVISSRIPQSLREMIQASWHSNPMLRPSATTIAICLAAMLDNTLGPLADQLSQLIRYQEKGPLREYFYGENLVDCLFDLEIVQTMSQALRLGNALMDVGLLHHIKHDAAFENGNELYRFDVHSIEIERPQAIPSLYSTLAEPKSLCRCRKLSQGFREKAPTSFFRLKKESPLKFKLLDECTLLSV